MPRRRKTGYALVSAWMDLVATGVATTTTLAVRVPQLMTGRMTPHEKHRMVTEKVTAATEGWLAGSALTARIVSKRRKRPARLEVANDLMDIAEAMARPAQRRVKSNAVRLTKG